MSLLLAALFSATWTPLPPLPDEEGFAGPFAGVSHGTLIVAGGANFPEKKPWEGGRKVWYDTVFALDHPSREWRVAGKLPRPLGYGVCAPHGETVVCVGGSDATRHYADAFRLELNQGRIVATPLPALPRPVANACGALVGETMYVAGGLERPDATEVLDTFYAIDLSHPDAAWHTLDPCPGGGRLLAVAASFEDTLFIAGGVKLVAGGDGKPARRYLKDAWRYHPETGWMRMADLPHSIAAAPSPAPTNASGFTILGGDDGTQVNVPPDRHTGFNRTPLVYEATADSWNAGDPLPDAPVTVPCVRWNDRWIIPSGEIRPGIRTPAVWSFNR